MKLGEAIKHLEESLSDHGHDWGCEECKGEHEQLLEWLRELKELREENKVLTSECDRLIKEKGELLKKSEQIAEYKRLLNEAVDDLRWLTKWHDPCELCGLRDEDGDCPVDLDKGIDCDNIYKWRLEAEALKLIGEDGGNNA